MHYVAYNRYSIAVIGGERFRECASAAAVRPDGTSDARKGSRSPLFGIAVLSFITLHICTLGFYS